MSTRPIVEEAIAAIEDNGNNTAVEVRDVLTKLLDYTENDPPPSSSLQPFSFVTTGPISDGSTGSNLQYSCRGFVRTFANFTFLLTISDNSEGNIFTFPLQEDHAAEMLEILEAILTTDSMRFAVPFRVVMPNDNSARVVAVPLSTGISFRLMNGVPVVRFDLDWFLPTGEEHSITNARTYSSVCFHSSDRILEG